MEAAKSVDKIYKKLFSKHQTSGSEGQWSLILGNKWNGSYSALAYWLGGVLSLWSREEEAGIAQHFPWIVEGVVTDSGRLLYFTEQSTKEEKFVHRENSRDQQMVCLEYSIEYW